VLLTGLSAQRLGFDHKPVCVGFVVNKVALVQALLYVLRLSAVNPYPANVENMVSS